MNFCGLIICCHDQVPFQFFEMVTTVGTLCTLCWFSQRRRPTPRFWGCTQGGYDPQIWTRPRLLYNAPTPQVSSSCVYSFRPDLKLSCWQTNKQTNNVRWKHPTLFAVLRRWVNIESACKVFPAPTGAITHVPLWQCACWWVMMLECQWTLERHPTTPVSCQLVAGL